MWWNKVFGWCTSARKASFKRGNFHSSESRYAAMLMWPNTKSYSDPIISCWSKVRQRTWSCSSTWKGDFHRYTRITRGGEAWCAATFRSHRIKALRTSSAATPSFIENSQITISTSAGKKEEIKCALWAEFLAPCARSTIFTFAFHSDSR